MRGGYANNYSSTNWHYFNRIDSRRTHLSRIVRMEVSLIATVERDPIGHLSYVRLSNNISPALRATLFGTSYLCAITHITEFLL
jgi:hypothetical protein